MNRTIEYTIPESQNGLRVEQFLRRKGYSRQNLTEIKRMPQSILVINKPAGMPIHPSMKNYYNSLANALAWYYQDQGKPFIFRCSNRLDRDTSGLTVISKHLVSASIMADITKKTPGTQGIPGNRKG